MKKTSKYSEQSLFKDIAEKEIEEMLLCAKAKEKEYLQDTYIFRQGEKPSKLFLIIEGRVMIAKDFASGKRDVLFMVEKGDVFGEMFLFAGMNGYWYDAIAQSSVKILEIPWEFFYSFCNKACSHHQLITRNMLEIQSEKNFMMTKKLHLLAGTTLRERIALWIMEQLQFEEREEIVLKMNREAMADYLGIARPSLSREMMKMQQEGIISVEKNKLRVLNINELENLCG